MKFIMIRVTMTYSTAETNSNHNDLKTGLVKFMVHHVDSNSHDTAWPQTDI